MIHPDDNIRSIVGTVEHHLSDGAFCSCCPNGKHRYGATLHLTPGAVSKSDHLNTIQWFIFDFIARHGYDGKKVRVTCELEDE